MAALTRHAFLSGTLARWSPILTSSTKVLVIPARGSKVKKPPQKPKPKPTIDSIMDSISAKGFLRSYKPYDPPTDVSERLNKLCESEKVNVNDDTVIEDLLLRFNLFNKCEEEFNHEIPNSMLVSIQTVGDLREFYLTPVSTTTPYDALQNMDLPPNLHIQKNYHRYHPETDALFGDKTAFPLSATIVTGLKYKDKYPGHRPEKAWPNKVNSIKNFIKCK